MSHTMNIKIDMKDFSAVSRAAKRLNLPAIEDKVHRLYSSTEEGLGIFLPGWKYPVVVKKDGTVSFDNYEGRWGNIEYLNKFKAHYGLEKAKAEAQRKGYRVFETYDKNSNELVLKIQTGRKY